MLTVTSVLGLTVAQMELLAYVSRFVGPLLLLPAAIALRRWYRGRERERALRAPVDVEPEPWPAAERERLARLRETLVQRLDPDELATLCFDLGVDDEIAAGRGRAALAQALVAHLARRALHAPRPPRSGAGGPASGRLARADRPGQGTGPCHHAPGALRLFPFHGGV